MPTSTRLASAATAARARSTMSRCGMTDYAQPHPSDPCCRAGCAHHRYWKRRSKSAATASPVRTRRGTSEGARQGVCRGGEVGDLLQPFPPTHHHRDSSGLAPYGDRKAFALSRELRLSWKTIAPAVMTPPTIAPSSAANSSSISLSGTPFRLHFPGHFAGTKKKGPSVSAKSFF